MRKNITKEVILVIKSNILKQLDSNFNLSYSILFILNLLNKLLKGFINWYDASDKNFTVRKFPASEHFYT